VPVPLCPQQVHTASIYGALPLLANTFVVYVRKFSHYAVCVRGSDHSNSFLPYPYRISYFEYSIATSLSLERLYFLRLIKFS
jgi:hypothetical protein